MNNREFFKILKNIETKDIHSEYFKKLLLETLETERKDSIYVTVGCLCILGGLFFGWLIFGYAPSLRG